MGEFDRPGEVSPEELRPDQLHAQVRLMVSRLPYNIPEVGVSLPANFLQFREQNVITDFGVEIVEMRHQPNLPEDMRGDLAEDIQAEMLRRDLEMTLSDYFTRRARGLRGKGERALSKEAFKEKFDRYLPLSKLTTSCVKRLEANIGRAYETDKTGALAYADEQRAVWNILVGKNIFLTEQAMIAEQQIYASTFQQIDPEEDQRWREDYFRTFTGDLEKPTQDLSVNL